MRVAAYRDERGAGEDFKVFSVSGVPVELGGEVGASVEGYCGWRLGSGG